jgi:hypothetical protein
MTQSSLDFGPTMFDLMDFRSRLLVKLLFGYIFLTVDVYNANVVQGLIASLFCFLCQLIT